MLPVPSKALHAVAPALMSIALLALAGCGKEAPAPEPERAVRTQLLSRDSAGLTHEYAAEIRARTESRLSFRVGGKLQSRLVNLGDTVKPGQVLARLDAQDLMLAQESAKANLLAARVNRDQMSADYKRFVELKEQGFISAAELERRDTAFKAAQAQLEQAKAAASAQGNQTGYAQLVADAPGVVTAVEAEPGMVVAAGTPVVRVAVDGPRDVVFTVPEDQLAQVRGAAARPGALKVRLWGEGQGAARDIALREVSAATDPVTRTFMLKADAGKLDAKLGQTATVTLELPRVEQIIKLPLAAVLEQQGQTSVWLLDPKTMTVKPQPVTIGGADGNAVVISGGLSPGQEVVIAGVHVLTPGQKVKRYQEPGAAAARAASATPAASR
ncbi:efflux RND transporter periplasmic adaptor subunit [Roseateles violae]|uniref:Efflux RND transporter periplasmic adaptor subunit n=1 Tax=Roseateles violae TaxID=3058042 RepID=A0ABT8DZK2_9BURK|nr:efflux RND transporter periplasmic adaptor subunit [Pelomonas sp. PFR6]MDN3922992.1 efflux RND transporter periplasmic adaptor subunit [Pelomonas sp. PFR6]